MEQPSSQLRLSWVCTPRASLGCEPHPRLRVLVISLFPYIQLWPEDGRYMENFKDQSLSLSLPEQFATLPHWMGEPSDRALLLGLFSVSCLMPPGDLNLLYSLFGSQVHTFRGPHWCEYCANFMWGLIAQGVRCSGKH